MRVGLVVQRAARYSLAAAIALAALSARGGSAHAQARGPIGPTVTAGATCSSATSPRACSFGTRLGFEFIFGEVHAGALGDPGLEVGLELGTGFAEFYRGRWAKMGLALRAGIDIGTVYSLYGDRTYLLISNRYGPSWLIRLGPHIALIQRTAIGFTALDGLAAGSPVFFRFSVDVRAGVAWLF